jgi:glyceraldehyde 3-phosphate dehydrogenase
MTTIHAYTGDQKIIDTAHKDLRRARAGAVSMIPTSTGAARAVGLVIKEVAGKLDGCAIRVPTPNVSMIDLTFQSKKKVTTEDINNQFLNYSKGDLEGILGYNTESLVSVDFNHSPYSSIFDATQTQVIKDDFCRVVSWYDNEWGFSNRMVDVARYFYNNT